MRSAWRASLATMLASGLIAATAAPASAQEPAQVTGLTVRQADGFATLGWTPVAGATEYDIERTPVDAGNAPTGPAAIVGVWRPNRTVAPSVPRFADAGFNPATASGGASAPATARRRAPTRAPSTAPPDPSGATCRSPARTSGRSGS